MKCIDERQYVIIVVEHLTELYPELLKGIDNIVTIGMGYSYFKNEINCEMIYEINEIPTVKLNKKRKRSK
jgi:hypothetical protein